MDPRTGRKISGQVDKGKRIVKLATVDVQLVRPIKNQKERHVTVQTHTPTERNQGAESWKARQNPQIPMFMFIAY